MFVIGASDSYSWPVEIVLPADGGKLNKQTFTAVFARLGTTRLSELNDQLTAGQITTLDIVKEVLVGWKDVSDSNGNDIPFSTGFRDKILEIANVAPQILAVYMDSVRGKIKN